MCQCTPGIKTPFCGRGSCQPPSKDGTERKYRLTLPDLTLDEAMKIIEECGGGSVALCSVAGTPASIPEHHLKLYAWPRHNRATIEAMSASVITRTKNDY